MALLGASGVVRGALFFLAVTLLAVGCIGPRRSAQSRATFVPTATEIQLAVSLAERAIAERKLRTESPLYLVGTELYRDKQAEIEGKADHKVLVTHYRYEGDLGIQTIVDVSRHTVVKTETIPHLPTPLAPAELAKAKELALSDPQVSRALEPYRSRLEVQGLVIRTMSQEDPFFGHRVVRLLFRVGRDYLRRPIVAVDLTATKVTIEEPPVAPGHEMK